MNCSTHNLFSRGMVTVSVIAILLTLCLFATPTSAAMKHKDTVSVAGDLDDIGGIKFDLMGSGATGVVGGTGPETVVARDREGRTFINAILELFLLELDPLWVQIRHR